ncbi:hypothetical protein ABRY77_10615 [Enterococcus casseliflavus]|jgi:hypothetical protein|uniref:hypothetical protein n=1 Tax=Enterococcus casseliflavus TaxID=37734 RepID=UPI003EDFFB45
MTKKEKKEVEVETKTTPPEKKYEKNELLKSKEFSKIEADFLAAYLPEAAYSVAEAKQLLIKLRKEKVK